MSKINWYQCFTIEDRNKQSFMNGVRIFTNKREAAKYYKTLAADRKVKGKQVVMGRFELLDTKLRND